MESFGNDTAVKDYEPVQPQNSALQITKFKNLARSKFQDSVKYNRDFLEFARENSKYNLSIIPAEYNEIFVDYKQAEYYWINESPLLALVESLIRSTGNKNFEFDKSFREIKNFYSKWATQKSPKEKQYFALSTVNVVERSINNTNFINYILTGIIYAFEPSISDMEKSKMQFEKSMQILEATAFSSQHRGVFNYLINLFQGLIYLRLGELEAAQDKFYEAQNSKANGITAIIYSGYIANKLGDYSGAVTILGEVISYDKKRIQYAIENKSVPLFKYFLQYAFVYNILAELDFANLSEDIDALIEYHFIQEGFPLSRVNTILNGLSVVNYSDYLTGGIKKQIEFVVTMSSQFDNNPNVITMMMGTYLLGRVRVIINSIIDNIKNKHYDKVNVDLSMYDHEIKELSKKINSSDGSFSEIKASYEKGMNEWIKAIESQTEDVISVIENQIENIESNEKFSPSTSFSNSLFYSVLVAIIVFIVFGFAGGMWGVKEIGSNYMGMMSDVFSIGLKWGSGTFVIGLVVSFFSAASAGWEKTNEKQRLMKSIAHYNNYKDHQIDQIKKDTKMKIEYHQKRQEESTKDIGDRIKKLQNERESQEAALTQLAEDEIAKISSKLYEILESI